MYVVLVLCRTGGATLLRCVTRRGRHSRTLGRARVLVLVACRVVQCDVLRGTTPNEHVTTDARRYADGARARSHPGRARARRSPHTAQRHSAQPARGAGGLHPVQRHRVTVSGTVQLTPSGRLIYDALQPFGLRRYLYLPSLQCKPDVQRRLCTESDSQSETRLCRRASTPHTHHTGSQSALSESQSVHTQWWWLRRAG